MQINLEFDGEADLAVMVIIDKDHRTEVRGHLGVGTDWVGDQLDLLLAALPRTINISSLFANEVRHLREQDAQAVRNFLKFSTTE
jgi:hypothetical protein